MNDVFNVVKAVLTIVLLFAGIVLIGHLDKLVVDTNNTVTEFKTTQSEFHQFLVDTHKRTNAILTHVDAVAGRAQTTMGKIEAASRRQEEVSSRGIAIMDRTEDLIETAGTFTKNLNMTVLNFNTEALKNLRTLNATLHDLDTQVKDPAITEIMRNTQETTKQGAIVFTNLATTTARIDKKAEELTKPGSFIKHLIFDIVHFGADARRLSGK